MQWFNDCKRAMVVAVANVKGFAASEVDVMEQRLTFGLS